MNNQDVAAWLGLHHLPIIVRVGIPAVSAIHVPSDAGEIVLGTADDDSGSECA